MSEIIVVSKDELIALFDEVFAKIDHLEQKIDTMKRIEVHFSKKQAAQYLNISVRSLDTHTKDAKIKYTRAGGKILFKKSDLDSYLLKNEARFRKSYNK